MIIYEYYYPLSIYLIYKCGYTMLKVQFDVFAVYMLVV